MGNHCHYILLFKLDILNVLGLDTFSLRSHVKAASFAKTETKSINNGNRICNIYFSRSKFHKAISHFGS